MDNELRSEFLSGYKVAQILMSLPDASELDVPFDKFSESHAPVRGRSPAAARPLCPEMSAKMDAPSGVRS